MTTPERPSLGAGAGARQRDGVKRDQWTRTLLGFGRAAVLELRTSSRRRVFAPTLSVHDLTPARPLSTSPTTGPAASATAALATWSPNQDTGPASRWDWHLRRDLASRLLEQVAPAESGADPAVLVAWTRSGTATPQDGDAAWWAALASAAADVRVPVRCLVVVTRWGWWTLPEGPEHYWQRLRDRRVRAPAGTDPAPG